MENQYTYEVIKANNGLALHVVYTKSIYQHGFAVFNAAPDAISYIKENKKKHALYGAELVYNPSLSTSGKVLEAYKSADDHFSDISRRQVFVCSPLNKKAFDHQEKECQKIARYRKIETWEAPEDGDIVIMLDPVYNSRENVFRYVKKAYRAKNVKQSCFSATLENIAGKTRRACLVNNNSIVAIYTKV